MYCSANNGISPPQQQLSPFSSLGGFSNNEEITLLHHPADLLSYNCLLETTSPQVYRPVKLDKKDRHSKIFTAQGQRNRRIRLSMEIGRKFFDLQDLLGFEKASKTLDWLLTKSKTAIKDLIHMMSIDDDDPRAKTFSGECEKKKKVSKKQIRKPSKRKDVEKGRMVKEIRAKARERARERTKEKHLLRKLNEENKLLSYLNSFPISDQAISSISGSTISLVNGLLCFQPNLNIISRESSSNFSHWSQNWDMISSSS